MTMKKDEDHPLRAIKEGISYSYSHPLISPLLFTAAIGAIFCFSQATIMPVLVEKVFREGTTGLGSLLSATGLGALIASLIISSQSKKVSAIWFIGAGNITFIISMTVFSFIANLQVAMICLFFSGLGLTLQFSSVYATIQKLVKEEYRGRVSSIYVLLFIGFSPLGNLFIGSTATVFGPQLAIRICLGVLALYGAYMVYTLPKARKKYSRYQSQLAYVKNDSRN